MILTLRTDKPDAEIGLYEGYEQLAYHVWPAHRQLAETLHHTIDHVLTSQKAELTDLTGLIVYKGPGSFTGLRIGLSVVNALAASYQLPVVATTGEQWISDGLAFHESGDTAQFALPEYGSDPHITSPKK